MLVFRIKYLALSETFVLAQAQGLRRYRACLAGLDSVPGGNPGYKAFPCHLLSDYTRWLSLERWRLRRLGRVNRRWLAAIAAHRPQLVHAHFGPAAARAIPLCDALDLPLVVTYHGWDIHGGGGSHGTRERDAVFARASRVIAVSDFVHRLLLDAGCPPAKIVRHYIGVDVESFAGRGPQSAVPRVAFVGRLIPFKGCIHLLRAMRQVWAQLPQAMVDIVGDGPLRATLEAAAGADPRVVFHGSQPHHRVREIIDRAWLLCNPSVVDDSGRAESFGMVFMEAQALGRPAVSFDNGGLVEAIADGVSGYTVASGDDQALAARLIALLSDAPLRARMGRAARQRVETHFNLFTQCRALEGIYDAGVAAH